VGFERTTKPKPNRRRSPPKTQISTLAALAYHKSTGRVATPPNQRMGFAENFLYMLDASGVPTYRWVCFGGGARLHGCWLGSGLQCVA
jgi:hypothetical protein